MWRMPVRVLVRVRVPGMIVWTRRLQTLGWDGGWKIGTERKTVSQRVTCVETPCCETPWTRLRKGTKKGGQQQQQH